LHWRIIDKASTERPGSGTYKNWKSLLAQEGGDQCVYCAIHEGRFGGERNFHVEHFRPKSKFSHLENEFSNLFYACSICNSFKGSDWPAEPCDELSVASYVDPSLVDYNLIFSVIDNYVSAGSPSAMYMIERLYLNRPQLIMDRRLKNCHEKIEALKAKIYEMREMFEHLHDKQRKSDVSDVLVRLSILLVDTLSSLSAVNAEKPYASADVSRTRL